MLYTDIHAHGPKRHNVVEDSNNPFLASKGILQGHLRLRFHDEIAGSGQQRASYGTGYRGASRGRHHRRPRRVRDHRISVVTLLYGSGSDRRSGDGAEIGDEFSIEIRFQVPVETPQDLGEAEITSEVDTSAWFHNGDDDNIDDGVQSTTASNF